MATESESLPAYAPLLKSFHREFARELRSMVRKLPIHAGAQVLEVATGDGQFAIWLDEMVGRAGSVTAVDISQAWLRDAAQRVDRANARGIDLLQADATKLPFKDATFDFVWNAQSLYSLPRINACLAEMQRVLRPGGRIALLENDSLHHVLLPWPVDLELHLRVAELKYFQATASRPGKFYAGRWLSRLLRQAKFVRPQERSFAYTRQQPLSADAEEFFQSYLHGLRERVEPWLKPKALQRLERLTDPLSRRCLWKQPDFVAVCIDRVVWAEKR